MDIGAIIAKVVELIQSGKLNEGLIQKQDADGILGILKENGVKAEKSDVVGVFDFAKKNGLDPSKFSLADLDLSKLDLSGIDLSQLNLPGALGALGKLGK
ncbi:MAG: hypothetical protein IJU67_00770 [Lachnospiraceae bacterium]|nr:hypothetical protein [Lachnospiraceae bacterium]MBQ1399059.1 hypothetical protein [Lachnospiraceae bacterium]MBQ3399812.1 hypothetical protein [Lachnospiraceae bacterium]MBQ9463788.1 hypothetical protein [Lachnospiraceae bacterium]MBR0105701.1 hypothetical protein [Lachnospiraceae bacterium]